IMRRPIAVATVTAAVLLVLSIPFYSMKFTSVDAQILGTEHSARQVDDTLNADFPPHRDSPVRVLVENSTPANTAKAAQDDPAPQSPCSQSPPLSTSRMPTSTLMRSLTAPTTPTAVTTSSMPCVAYRIQMDPRSWSPGTPPTSSTSHTASPSTSRSRRRSSWG